MALYNILLGRVIIGKFQASVNTFIDRGLLLYRPIAYIRSAKPGDISNTQREWKVCTNLILLNIPLQHKQVFYEKENVIIVTIAKNCRNCSDKS